MCDKTLYTSFVFRRIHGCMQTPNIRSFAEAKLKLNPTQGCVGFKLFTFQHCNAGKRFAFEEFKGCAASG